MKKRVLAFVLTIAMLFSMVPGSVFTKAYADEAAEGITFIGFVTWNGGEEARPSSVKLTLKQSTDGENWVNYKGSKSVVNVSAPYWGARWEKLPETDAQTGEALKYCVEASPIQGFYFGMGKVENVEGNIFSQQVSYSYIVPAAPAVEEEAVEEAPAAEEAVEETPAAEEAVEEAPAAEEAAEEAPAAEEAVEEAPAAEEAEEAPAAEEAEEVPAAEEAAEEAPAAEEEEAPAAEEAPAVEETEEVPAAAEEEEEEIIFIEDKVSPSAPAVQAPEKTNYDLRANSSVNATVTKPADIGGVNVDDKDVAIAVNLSFALGSKSEEACEYTSWVYDYASVFEHNSALINTAGMVGGTGALVYDGNVAGTFEIKGTQIIIYPDYSVLGDMKNIVTTVKLDLSLDVSEIHTEEGGDIDFNGNVIHLSYLPHISSTKYVGETADSVHVADGEVFDHAEVNANGDYVIYYKVTGISDRDLNSFTVSDTMSAGQSINGSIKVTANGVTKTVPASGNSFEIDIKETFGYAKYVPANTEYVLEYSVTVDKNSDLTVITNAETWNANNGRDFSDDHVSVKINTFAPYTFNKVWDDANDQDGRRAEYGVTLYKTVDGKKTAVGSEVKLDKDTLTYTWTDLPHLTSDGKIISYSVDETSVPAGYTKSVKGNTVTNKHTPETVTVKGAKTWDDNNNQDGKRPSSITVILKADGVEVARKTVTGTAWSWDFGSRPKYADGKLIEYTIEELPVAGYETTVNGFNVTNKHTPEKINISGTKTWKDGGSHPDSITVYLKNGSTTVRTLTVKPDANGNWSYTFENVDKYANGQVINYTVDEAAITGYKKTVSGTNITNEKVTSVTMKKVWNDDGNRDAMRASYKVTLYKTVDGVKTAVGTVTRTATQTSYTWSNLPEYENGKKIVYTVEESTVPAGYTSKVDGYTITNTHVPATTHISGEKTWNDKGEASKRPASITVNLLADGKVIATKTVTAADGWKWDFGDLPKNKLSNGKAVAIKYTVTENEVDNYVTTVNGYNITNTTSTSYSFEKIWDDNNNQDGKRGSYTVVLYSQVGSGAKTAVDTVVLDAGTTSKNWPKLPLYTADGQVITYSVDETALPAGYTKSVNGNTITNTHVPEKTQVPVNKVWIDDGTHPAKVTVKLFINGSTTAIASMDLTAANNWQGVFADLDKYANGSEIRYYVDEVPVAEYTHNVTGDQYNGFTVTNIKTSGGEGTKTWYDYDNAGNTRPASITVILKADGKEIQRKVVTAANGWRWTWDPTPEYAADGHKIVYTVEELPVNGYTSLVNGNSIINVLLLDFNVKKIWDDDNNRDGLRASYGVTLFSLVNGSRNSVLVDRNGNMTGLSSNEKAGEVTLSKTTLSYSWHKLPAYTFGGVPINYTVEESTIPAGYERTLVYTSGNRFTNLAAEVTNKHVPDTITIPGHKVWNDLNESTRPGSITINLLKNGTKIESKTVTAENGWTWSFGPLFKNENGKAITYTITEDAVNGYFTNITGSQADGFVVTNSLETSYTVNKIWNDGDNCDGLRSDYKVTLYKSVGGAAREAVEEITLKKTQTSYTWNKLPAYENGEKITYSVDETLVPAGYTKSVNGNTITNTHEPEKINVTVNKIWNDNKNHAGDSILITLYADGVEVASKNVTANPNGQFSVTFSNLNKYKPEKQPITYTVAEAEVAGYITEINGNQNDGFTVINTPYTSFTVTKEWDDENDKYGMRSSYGVTLFKSVDGAEAVAVGAEVILAADKLDNTWEKLPVYEDGKLITYTAKETSVPKDYEASYNAEFTKITNTYIPVTIDIEGTKTWVDGEDLLGKRPAAITVNLFEKGNDEPIATQIVKAAEDGSWTYKFTGLRESRNGVKIEYYITEDAVESYKAVINGYNITNTLVTEVTATKIWEDRGDTSKRATYGITLYKTVEGKTSAVGREVKLDKDTLTQTWSDLPVFENGKLITYTVKETTVPAGFQVMYSQDGLTVTNVLLKKFTVTKIWNDADDTNRDKYGVTLYKIINGEKSAASDEVTLSKTQTTYTWNNLPAYSEDGYEIVYTAAETNVPNYYIVSYEDAQEGINITNTFKKVLNKEYDGLLGDDMLQYSIVVNEKGEKINDGEPMVVTDILPKQTELMRNTVKVICANGAEANISFEEGKLVFTIPDATRVTISYTLQSTAAIGEEVTYNNDVELEGKYIHQHDETTDPIIIQEHSATIEGATDLFTIYKIDADSIKTMLPGAQFELYKCEIDANGKITGAAKVGDTLTTNAQGRVRFEDVKEFALYYWVEVKAPENYIINENYPHYFVLYQEYSHQAQAVEVVNKVVAANGQLSIRALKGGTGWTVTNKMQMGNLEITKTVLGEGADRTQEFTFKITLGNNKIQGVYGDMTFVNGVATVTLRDGQVRKALNLPANTPFTVEEINTPSWFTVGSTGARGTIVADQTATAAFTNTYESKPTSVSFGGQKKISGPWPADAEAPTFTFTLTDNATDAVIDTQTTVGAGEFTFKTLTFEKAGEYTYTVKETKGDAAGFTYDEANYEVLVIVTDDHKGQLHAGVTGNESIIFTNPYEPAPTTAQFGGSKEFTGPWPEDVTKPTFEFTLSNGTEVIDTKTTVGAGEFTFKELSFDKVGTYTYTVKETAGNAAGVKYDTNTYTVTVKVTDAGKGQLAAEVTGAEKIVFTNEYEPKPVSVSFGGSKEFTGPWPEDVTKPTFEFTLSDESGVIDTKHTVGAGSFTFKELSFDKVGEYTFTVKETAGTDAVIYDTNTYTVTVKVTDAGKGQLAAEVTGAENIKFTNEYKPEGTTASFGGKKIFDGPWPAEVTAPTFEFTLSDARGVIDTKTTVGTGSFTFNELSFDKVGEYKYTVKETVGTAPGVKYDIKSYEVTVTVTDDGTGKLAASVSGAENIVFTNEYNPEGTTAQFGGKKEFTGPWPEDVTKPTFEFTLSNGTEVIDTKTTVGAGEFTFEELSFDKVGTYTYTVKETVGKDAVIYDTKSYEVTVTVTDDGTGKLAASVSGAENIVFTNEYNPEGTTAQFGGKKICNGPWPEDVTAPTFTFTLTDDATGKVIDTKTTVGADSFTFEALDFDKVGTYTYTVKETATGDPGVSYDDTEYTVTVTVTDDGTGKLAAEVTGAENIEFTNTYESKPVSIKLSGSKAFADDCVWPEDVELPEFTFTLSEGENVLQTKKANTANEFKFAFDELSYDAVCEHTYNVKETAGVEGDGWKYDLKEYIVVVKVTDIGDGQLHATITVDGEEQETDNLEFTELNFVNTYIPASVSIKLSGEKEFTGVWPEDVELPVFTFAMDEGELFVDEKTTVGADTFTFETLTYNKVGEHVYTVYEVGSGKDGFTYDMTKYEVTVKVTDIGDGKLHAEILVDGRSLGEDVLEFAALNFTNDYTPAPVSIKLSGEKEFTGVWPEDVELPVFTFRMDEGELFVDEKTTVGADKFEFDTIEYTEVGEHVYTVYEIGDGKDGFTYDMTKYEVTVKVTDIGDGYLHAEILVDGRSLGEDVLEFAALDFTNDYTPAPVSVPFGAGKTLEGREIAEGEFTFEVIEDGVVVLTAANDAEGNIDLGQITYDVVGVHDYIIREVKGDEEGVTYDETEYKATVTVTDIGDGYLHAAITGDTTIGTDLKFSNKYKGVPTSVTFEGMKTLTGRDLADKEFIFTLSDDKGNVLETVKNGADGKISFSSITYADEGVFNYTVKEVVEDEHGVYYDETVYNLTVTVVDNMVGKMVATITGDSTTGKDLNFLNEYKTGMLKIWKTVTGEDGELDRYFTFTVEFDDDGEYPFYGAYEGTIKSGDKIRLKHNQAIIIYDLPARISYTVTEEWAEGYRMSHMGAVGEILPNNMVTARFFNFKGTIIPKTGDDSDIALWTALLVASMGGVVGTSAVLLKKRKEDE